MKQLITVNLTTKSTDWMPPILTFGESLTLALRFQKSVSGNLVEPNFTFNSITASFGLVDARPGGGRFALQFGADPGTADNTTADLPADCTPAALAAAINAKTAVVALYGTATAKKVDGSWLLRFGTGATEVPFKVVNNSLWPVSFGRVTARQLDNAWVHELRLVQAPVAFTSSYDTVLPSLPIVSVLTHGGASGSFIWNTIQQLYIPADFRGTYRLKKGFQRTQPIAPDAGTDEIQAALIAAFGNTFTVTLPLSYHFSIEFAGDFAGTDVAALEVEGAEAPQGDLTFTLPLDRLELAALLRGVSAATLPLEVRIAAQEDGGDAQEIVALYVPMTVQRPLAFPELEELPVINWLRFPSPKSYTPFGADNVLTGEKIYAVTEGDGATTAFVITHGLASEDVQVFARVNASSGRQLVDGTDFTAAIDSANQVTVTALTGAPATDAWRIMVVAAKEIASWASDLTVAIGQVTGLEDDLTAINGRLTTLETLLPANASLPTGTTPANSFQIQLPPAAEILFARDATTGLPITDVTKLATRGAYLLPAINTATTPGALPTTPLPAPTPGALYSTSAAVLIPGGGHIRSSLSVAGGFVGSDGRVNYPVTRSGTKDSYFPTPFERTLFEVVINDMMFSPGTTLTLLFKLALQLINADTEAQWMLAIETGAITDETDAPPTDTYDTNLLSVDWNTTTPIVLQRLLISSALETHGFGCTIANSGGTFTGNGLLYKRVVAAPSGSLPANNSHQFALRARLFNFDTKNSVPDARGWLSWALQAPDSGILGVQIG
ncbi:MAG: hypothetical protein P4L99_24105 [Chthoniobacter sp.]|nr:hypothetical protein [Chthoniobacter sp.]